MSNEVTTVLLAVHQETTWLCPCGGSRAGSCSYLACLIPPTSFICPSREGGAQERGSVVCRQKHKRLVFTGPNRMALFLLIV